MSSVRDVYGAVFEGGSAVLMGRVAYADGALVVPGDIETITYRIDLRDSCSDGPTTPVVGHTDVSIASSAVLTDTLQTDTAWEEDSIGYNFRHEIDITAAPAFPEAHRSYLVRYLLTPSAGQPIIVRYHLEAI